MKLFSGAVAVVVRSAFRGSWFLYLLPSMLYSWFLLIGAMELMCQLCCGGLDADKWHIVLYHMAVI